jgi:hypothetical protein
VWRCYVVHGSGRKCGVDVQGQHYANWRGYGDWRIIRSDYHVWTVCFDGCYFPGKLLPSPPLDNSTSNKHPQYRLRANPTPESFSSEIPWKQSLNMLYAVSALIMVRSIFRVVEYIMGQNGYPLEHEWTLYIFDSCLMFAVTVIFYWRYPSELERAAIRDSANVQMVPQEVYGKV